MARIAMKPTGREGGTRTCPQGSTGTTATLRIILPRHLTTGMTRWRFQGTQFYSPTKSLLIDQVKSTKSNRPSQIDQVKSTKSNRLSQIQPSTKSNRSVSGRALFRWLRRRAGCRLRRSRRGRRGPRGGGCVGRRLRRLRLGRRVDPAGMHVIVQAVLHLVVDFSDEPGEAAERRLDVSARTAEPVVKIDVAERGIEVVAVHELNHPPAEPDAFRIAARAVDDLGRLGELVDLALVVLCDVAGGCGRRLARLVLVVAALSEAWSDGQQKDEPGGCEMAQNLHF